jgi:hypothetical protein
VKKILLENMLFKTLLMKTEISLSFLFFLPGLWVKIRPLLMLGKCSTTELHSQWKLKFLPLLRFYGLLICNQTTDFKPSLQVSRHSRVKHKVSIYYWQNRSFWFLYAGHVY